MAGAVLCGVAGGVAGAALFTTLQPLPAPTLQAATPTDADERADRAQRALDTGVSVVVAQLARDVDKLVLDVEALKPGNGAGIDTEPLSATARIEALERSLREVREALSAYGATVAGAAPKTRDAIEAGLIRLGMPVPRQGRRALASSGWKPDPRDPERVAHLLAMLTQHPNHPDAQLFLGTLCDIHQGWGRGVDALAALDQFADRVGLPAWQRDWRIVQAALAAGAYDRARREAETALEDESLEPRQVVAMVVALGQAFAGLGARESERTALRRILDHKEERVRASSRRARLEIARSFRAEGKRAPAIAAYRDILDAPDAQTHFDSFLSQARSELAELDPGSAGR